MLVIRTADEMARALSSPLEPTLKRRLATHNTHLSEYPDFSFEELGIFLVLLPPDSLDDLCRVSPVTIANPSAFVMEPETVDLHGDWLEVLFVLSDDGFGLVVFTALGPETDQVLLKACQELCPSLSLLSER